MATNVTNRGFTLRSANGQGYRIKLVPARQNLQLVVRNGGLMHVVCYAPGTVLPTADPPTNSLVPSNNSVKDGVTVLYDGDQRNEGVPTPEAVKEGAQIRVSYYATEYIDVWVETGGDLVGTTQ